ncbi:MAG: heparinase II/III domain-containing protein [Candidatus Latescibacterota bacterium]
MTRREETISPDHAALEPYTYAEDFESGSLRAWASYPCWQDTAYDPNFRIGRIVPDDPNTSIVRKVTPYANADNYAGAQKLLDMHLVPGSSISLRYFLKSHLPFEYMKIRLAAGPDGAVDYTIPGPPLNRWNRVTVVFDDILRQNPGLSGRKSIKVNALAVLAKQPKADPAMPFYLGLDDIAVSGTRMMEFRFTEPEVYKLTEWKPHIPKRHYSRGDMLHLRGEWPLDADRVSIGITSFTERAEPVYTGELRPVDGEWSLEPLELTWPEGLYYGALRAYRGEAIVSRTEFTLHIAPKDISGRHPRLWFDSATKPGIEARLRSERFRHIFDRLPNEAAEHRERVPAEALVFDLDQFPDEDWLPTWEAWGSRLYSTAEPLYVNALAYSFAGDREAGMYVRDVLIRVARFEHWTHPWQTKRGRFTEHRSGWWAHRLALAYDLVYDLLDDSERALVRGAFLEHIVRTTHRMYVEDNDVTGQTSNWISHTCGASLMLQAAMFGDSPETEFPEPYFTGALLKLSAFLERVTDPDGAWGEGLGYNNYSFHTLCQSLPALERVFGIDLSGPLDGSWREHIWAGPVQDRRCFYFGDTEGNLNPIANWAWLLPKYRDPLLGWFYNFLREGSLESNTQASMTGYMNLINKKNESFTDVLHETEQTPQKDPFSENPVKCFRKVGTTVFKSGWKPDDFIFVLRTGPFFNHQHLDQGTFWLADRGGTFIGERHGSSYYDDPLYQSHYTQPIAHSTILIDRNPQSQRTGDHLDFAGGFEDYAFIRHFLDGSHAAFVSGDIGRLYWGKVKSITRNVLYLKPRAVLMIDVITPGDRDADVTLLYQAGLLNEIKAGNDGKDGGKISTVTKGDAVLHIAHLYPDAVAVEAVETPHYLYTLRKQRPLQREGMLTVTARTVGEPLVMANLLTTTEGEPLDFITEQRDGCITGTVNGIPFAFPTVPGRQYTAGEFTTDALALTWTGDTVFAACCTVLERNGKVLARSEEPVVREILV